MINGPINIIQSDESKYQPNNNSSNQISNNISSYLPSLPFSMPQEPFDYNPPLPRRRFRLPVLSQKHLARRIYNQMVFATRDYGDLERLASMQDKNKINALQNQMQILSLVMLRIYRDISGRNTVPFVSARQSNLPNNYNRALQEMYDRVYYILELTIRLFNQTQNQSTYQSLLITILNLKSQLKQLSQLIGSQ